MIARVLLSHLTREMFVFLQAWLAVKDFVLATTLKDCSVMITLAVAGDGRVEEGWTLLLTEASPAGGPRLVYAVHVVDLDPKDVMKVGCTTLARSCAR